ncbi:EspA/EspE family type VII secretion system effector [Mycobacterium sp. 050128]|uniref:EspA/EspE family type VII secretion system effector n=1 Tax=Mycobacterium sp. 050128 TaxID=3096112 RepID=UPI002EDA95AA
MPKVSDVAKVPFTGITMVKGYATGNYKDAVANTILLAGQLGWAVGKYGPPSIFGKKLNDKWTEKYKDGFAKEVYLLELGIQLCQLLTILHGSATDKGQYYELGASNFELAWENLKDATASASSWSGASADAYNARNAEQMDWAVAMSGLDSQIAAILAREADDIKNSKLNLTYCRAGFTAAIPVAVMLRLYSPPVSWVFQITTFTVVMTAAIATTDIMRMTSEDNAAEIAGIELQYRAIAEAAVVKGSAGAPAPKLAPAPRSTAAQFDAPDGAASSTGRDMPATASSGSGRQLASAGATNTGDGATSAGYSPTEHAAAAALAPQGAPPSGTRSYPVAGVSQPTRPSGSRAAAESGTPRQGAGAQGAAAQAAVDEDVPGQDFQTAGAGGEGVERAPVDTTAGIAPPAQEARPSK